MFFNFSLTSIIDCTFIDRDTSTQSFSTGFILRVFFKRNFCIGDISISKDFSNMKYAWRNVTLRKHTARYDALFVDRYTWTAFRVYDFARLTCLVVNKNRGQISAIMIDKEKKRKEKNFSSLRIRIFTIFARNKFVKKLLDRKIIRYAIESSSISIYLRFLFPRDSNITRSRWTNRKNMGKIKK